jgi:hypothetical protein
VVGDYRDDGAVFETLSNGGLNQEVRGGVLVLSECYQSLAQSYRSVIGVLSKCYWKVTRVLPECC